MYNIQFSFSFTNSLYLQLSLFFLLSGWFLTFLLSMGHAEKQQERARKMPSCCVIAFPFLPLLPFFHPPLHAPPLVCSWLRTRFFLGARTSVIVELLRDGANLTSWGSGIVSKDLLMLSAKDDGGCKKAGVYFLNQFMVWTQTFGLFCLKPALTRALTNLR